MVILMTFTKALTSNNIVRVGGYDVDEYLRIGVNL